MVFIFNGYVAAFILCVILTPFLFSYAARNKVSWNGDLALGGAITSTIAMVLLGLISLATGFVHVTNSITFDGEGYVEAQRERRDLGDSVSGRTQAGSFIATKLLADSCEIIVEEGWREDDPRPYRREVYEVSDEIGLILSLRDMDRMKKNGGLPILG